MPSTSLIYQFLHDTQVPYTIVPHRPAFTAQEEAAATNVPGPRWAKVVICLIDDAAVQAVLPAHLVVNLAWLLDLARGRAIRLAEEDELRGLFPDCEPGAMPPFGPLYGQSVFVDVALAAESEIVFNAGSHSEAICMRWPDFAAIVRPIVGTFATPPIDHVGEFRLSFRE